MRLQPHLDARHERGVMSAASPRRHISALPHCHHPRPARHPSERPPRGPQYPQRHDEEDAPEYPMRHPSEGTRILAKPLLDLNLKHLSIVPGFETMVPWGLRLSGEMSRCAAVLVWVWREDDRSTLLRRPEISSY
eukprot:1152146-Rhodomonas_salina.1